MHRFVDYKVRSFTENYEINKDKLMEALIEYLDMEDKLPDFEEFLAEYTNENTTTG